MKVIIAPDSFKGSLSAVQAAAAMANGVRRVSPEVQIVVVPLADGGEGTVDAWLSSASGGRRETRTVTGPLGEQTDATFGVIEDGTTAIVESASAAGLALVPDELRDPTRTTTYGVGELIRHALDLAPARIVIGLGGTSTNDGGAGALQSLGVKFLDHNGSVITAPISGGMLGDIARIDASGFSRPNVSITPASDVNNPLTGPNGAAAVFGPQKGATSGMVTLLDTGLVHLAGLFERDLGAAIADRPGAGAAGGLGGALMAVFKAEAASGIDLLLDAVSFDELISNADFVITGEGSIDSQTLSGKAVAGILARSIAASRARVLAIGGRVDASTAEALRVRGLYGVEAAAPEDMSAEEAMSHASVLVARATARVFMRSIRG